MCPVPRQHGSTVVDSFHRRAIIGDVPAAAHVPTSYGRYAVVVTHNRPDRLAACLNAIAPQVDVVCVVDHASDPAVTPPAHLDNVVVVGEPATELNLSRMWNESLTAIEKTRPGYVNRWDVAVLADDVVVPDGWLGVVAAGMRGHGCVAASTPARPPSVVQPVVKRFFDNDRRHRMCPWAFVLRGETGLRCDETIRWTYAALSLDFHARAAGGMVIVPGPPIVNGCTDQWYLRDDLVALAAHDRQRFVDRFGEGPWS
jgi:hypothetical protein